MYCSMVWRMLRMRSSVEVGISSTLLGILLVWAYSMGFPLNGNDRAEQTPCRKTNSKRIGVRPRFPVLSGRPDVVPLAQLHPVGAQDVVRGGDMEVEIGIGDAEQILDAGEGDVPAAQAQRYRALLAAVDPVGRHRQDEVDGLRDALLEVGERLLGVVVLRDVDPGEPRHRALGAVAGDLHLPRQGKH